MLSALFVVLWVAHAVMAVIVVVNVAYLWYRRRSRAAFDGKPLVSVMIPARNEETNLPRLLASLLPQRDVRFEVIVYDDASTDRTHEEATRVRDPRLRVLRGAGPPAGWVGKVHALFQASRVATGDVYVFLDADTVLKDSGALRRLVEHYTTLPARSVLTALPHFRGGAALLVSAVPHALLVSLPLPLVPRVRSRVFAALNGQMWMIARDVYHELEPHERHASEVLEDVQIGRYLSVSGVNPVFADVQDELEVWMYPTVGAAWRGFRKNAYLLMGNRPLPFAVLWVWITLAFVVAPLVSIWFLIPIIGTKLLADRFMRQPLWVSLLAPVTFGLWSILNLDSAISHLRGRVEWKDRDVANMPDPAR